jgi:hypothetical protein
MPHILKKYPLATLEIIGKGPAKQKLMDQIRKLKLEKHVSLFGEKITVEKYLKHWDVFALPSISDQHMLEQPHIEEPAQPHAGPPDPSPQYPVRFGQVFRSPAPAHFHDRDFVALFGEPVRRDAASESGTDHDEVEIALGICHETHIAAPLRGCRAEPSRLGLS